VNTDTKRQLAYILIILSLILGGGYYWGLSYIVADTTPPEIQEEATTSGDMAYGTGRPTVLCFVKENIGMDEVTARINGIGAGGVEWTLVEQITLTYQDKTGDIYSYRGSFKEALQVNKEYYLTYRAVDHSGHVGSWRTRIKLVQLEGWVKVNGNEVKEPGDTLYVTTLDLHIVVGLETGAAAVDRIYALVGGEEIDFTPNPQYAARWDAYYTLPGDGKYAFLVQVIDTAGGDIQLASFTINMGTRDQLPIILGVAAVLGGGALLMYTGEERDE
jgi:hypothetical protein